MIVCGMEKYSMVDYPDRICCTLFTLSCNFRCPFCQNSGLVLGGTENAVIDESEIFAYLEKRKRILDGVCISGGEPTLQKDLREFIEKVRSLGLLVKLDTNGSNPAVLEDLFSRGLLDFVAMDIKNAPSCYGPITGIPGFDPSNVEKSVEIIRNSGVDYEFRTTLVEEFHDEDKMEEIGKWLKGAKSYRLQRFEDRGQNIRKGLHPVDKDRALVYLETVRKYVPSAELRNYG